MLDLSFPWPIGPVPIALTAWALYGLYRAVVTRDGLTSVSAVSVLGLVAFLAAAIAQMVEPAIDQILVIMLAQFLGTAVCFLFGKLLLSVQKTKPELSLKRLEARVLFRSIAAALGGLVVFDGVLFLFPDAGKCDHFTGYMADKCAAQELFFGIHDAPLMTYLAVLLGVPFLASLVVFAWVQFKTAGTPKRAEPGSENNAGG